jgi:CMP-N,N'-diacetyllegionaminic acid synthase
MKFLAIIPARKGSKTIKNKNLKKFNNKPLIYWTIKSAIESGCFDKIMISTDSSQIQKFSKKFKVECPYLRNKKLSGDKSNMHEVIIDTVKYCENNNYFPDAVVLLQPTSPLRDKNDIINCCKKFKKFIPDSLVSVTKVPHNFNPRNLYSIKKNLLISSNNRKRLIQRQSQKSYYARNGACLYITKIDKIKKYILGGKLTHYIMNNLKSIDINTIEEFQLAEIIQKKFKYNI